MATPAIDALMKSIQGLGDTRAALWEVERGIEAPRPRAENAQETQEQRRIRVQKEQEAARTKRGAAAGIGANFLSVDPATAPLHNEMLNMFMNLAKTAAQNELKSEQAAMVRTAETKAPEAPLPFNLQADTNLQADISTAKAADAKARTMQGYGDLSPDQAIIFLDWLNSKNLPVAVLMGDQRNLDFLAVNWVKDGSPAATVSQTKPQEGFVDDAVTEQEIYGFSGKPSNGETETALTPEQRQQIQEAEKNIIAPRPRTTQPADTGEGVDYIDDSEIYGFSGKPEEEIETQLEEEIKTQPTELTEEQQRQIDEIEGDTRHRSAGSSNGGDRNGTTETNGTGAGTGAGTGTGENIPTQESYPFEESTWFTEALRRTAEEGTAMPEPKTLLPSLIGQARGTPIRFRSGQAERNMTLAEQSSYKRMIEEAGVPWDEFRRQELRTRGGGIGTSPFTKAPRVART